MLCVASSLRRGGRLVSYCQRRYKKKVAKVTNTKRAMDYFDIALPPVYQKQWPSIRLALLCKQKYVSVLNNFADCQDIIEDFWNLGAIDIRWKYSHMVKKMKGGETNQMSLEADDGKSPGQGDHEEAAVPIRPSLIELDDDELATKAEEESQSRYPEEYRLRVSAEDTPGSVDLDLTSRIVLPSEVGPGGPSILHDHVPATKLKGLENWMEETDLFVNANQTESEIGLQRKVQREPINFPSTLQIFTFKKGDISHFPQPKLDPQMMVYTHYLMDGASLLPVLALDLQPGERLLDMCAAPGGKTLLALQSMLPGMVVSNDRTDGRTKRLKNVLQEYIPSNLTQIQDTIFVSERDACIPWEHEAFDKVLVDAPCLTDRHVLHESDNSIFSPRRAKERLKLPELQSQLLVSALHMVRPGGCVVYSTCTLSPLQNDGVVHLALSKIWQETRIDCCVVDLTHAIHPLRFLYELGTNLGLRYGQIVLPSVLSNFGPMYFAKIKRLK